MKLSSKNLCIIFSTFIYLISFSASTKETDTPPFFKITYQNSAVYLLGSVHVGKPDFYPLPKIIQHQLDQSDAIVLEAVPSEADHALVARYSMPTVPYKIQNTDFDQYCKNRRPFCNAIKQFSPWVIATQITLSRLNKLGYHAHLGIESHLIKNKGSKPLLQLESMEFQLNLMSSLKKSTQQSMLSASIKAPNDQITDMFTAWRTGDLSIIDEISQQELKQQGDDEFIEKLLWSRNKNMADALITQMKQHPKQQLFATIGAAHLAGDKSINQYLQNAGAKVENCWSSPTVCQ